MSLSYMLSAAIKGGQIQDPILSASTTRSMLRHHLDELHLPRSEPLTLQMALPITHNILAIAAGYLASLPDGERIGFDDTLLEMLGMSTVAQAEVDPSAVSGFAHVFESLLERTADDVALSELKNALPTLRAILAQGAALYFAQDPLLNPPLALFVCQDIDRQIMESSPLQAVVMIGFLSDQMLSAGRACSAERVDLGRDPGPGYDEPDDDERAGAADDLQGVPFEPVVRSFDDLTPDELTRPFIPVDEDAALLDTLVTRHAALVSRPETAMLDLLRVVAAIRMKRRELDVAHRINIDVRRQNLRLVDL